MKPLVLVLLSCGACHLDALTMCNRYVDAFNRCMDGVIVQRGTQIGITKLDKTVVCENLRASDAEFYKCLMLTYEKTDCASQESYENALATEQDCIDSERN